MKTEAQTTPKSQHTAGEWGVRDNQVFVKDSGKTIATIHVCKNYEDITFKPVQDFEMEANAKLMAAAPELLSSLIFLLKNFDSEKNSAQAIIMANCAIKKVTE